MARNLQVQLRSRIETFATDLASLVERAVADAIGEALAVTPRTGGKQARGARRATSSAVASPAVTAALLTEIHKKGGRRIEELSRSLKVPSPILSRAVKALIADGKVRAKGKARGTRYQAR